MMAINRTTPSREWPDMVGVLQKGTINYAIQFEGDRIKGNFLLPNTTDFPVMPMYAHVFARGVGLDSLNRMCGFLFMHLEIFSPGLHRLCHQATDSQQPSAACNGFAKGTNHRDACRRAQSFCRRRLSSREPIGRRQTRWDYTAKVPRVRCPIRHHEMSSDRSGGKTSTPTASSPFDWGAAKP